MRNIVRYFTVGEQWGPLECEKCGNRDANAIGLTQKEVDSLPDQYGPEAAAFIFEKELGVVHCDECREDR